MIITNIDDKHLQSVKIDEQLLENKKVIGTFHKNTCELEIININHQYNSLKGSWVNINGFGDWKIDELADDEVNASASLTLSDITCKFDIPYSDTFPFPDTLGNWAEWIGNQVGVPLIGDFPNSDKIVNELPNLGNNNPSYRDAVKVIGKYAGCYAHKNYDNTYSFGWFDSTLTTIEDFIDFVHGDETKEVNVLVLSTGDTNDNVKWPEQTPENPFELKIIDDFTYIDRYQLLVPIYNQINGFKYTPVTNLEIPYGLLTFRAGQMIQCPDMDFVNITTYISHHTLQWDGGTWDDINSWTSILEMGELEETSTAYKHANSLPNQLLEVTRLAKKNEGLIEDTIHQVNEQGDLLSQTVQSVESIQNLFQITGGSNLIKNSQFLLTDEVWTITKQNGGFCTELGSGYNANLIGKTTALANIVMKDATIVSKEDNITNLKVNQTYTLHFYYSLEEYATGHISFIGKNNSQVIVDETFNEECDMQEVTIKFVAYDTDYILTFDTTTSMDGKFTIYDLMLNSGDKKSWEPAISEIYSTVLKMSQLGLQIYASGSKTLTLMTSMGFKIHKSSNGEIGEVITQFTDSGIITKTIVAEDEKLQEWVIKPVTINSVKHLTIYKEG